MRRYYLLPPVEEPSPIEPIRSAQDVRAQAIEEANARCKTGQSLNIHTVSAEVREVMNAVVNRVFTESEWNKLRVRHRGAALDRNLFVREVKAYLAEHEHRLTTCWVMPYDIECEVEHRLEAEAGEISDHEETDDDEKPVSVATTRVLPDEELTQAELNKYHNQLAKLYPIQPTKMLTETELNTYEEQLMALYPQHIDEWKADYGEQTYIHAPQVTSYHLSELIAVYKKEAREQAIQLARAETVVLPTMPPVLARSTSYINLTEEDMEEENPSKKQKT